MPRSNKIANQPITRGVFNVSIGLFVSSERSRSRYQVLAVPVGVSGGCKHSRSTDQVYAVLAGSFSGYELQKKPINKRSVTVPVGHASVQLFDEYLTDQSSAYSSIYSPRLVVWFET